MSTCTFDNGTPSAADDYVVTESQAMYEPIHDIRPAVAQHPETIHEIYPTEHQIHYGENVIEHYPRMAVAEQMPEDYPRVSSSDHLPEGYPRISIAQGFDRVTVNENAVEPYPRIAIAEPIAEHYYTWNGSELAEADRYSQQWDHNQTYPDQKYREEQEAAAAPYPPTEHLTQL